MGGKFHSPQVYNYTTTCFRGSKSVLFFCFFYSKFPFLSYGLHAAALKGNANQGKHKGRIRHWKQENFVRYPFYLFNIDRWCLILASPEVGACFYIEQRIGFCFWLKSHYDGISFSQQRENGQLHWPKTMFIWACDWTKFDLTQLLSMFTLTPTFSNAPWPLKIQN